MFDYFADIRPGIFRGPILVTLNPLTCDNGHTGPDTALYICVPNQLDSTQLNSTQLNSNVDFNQIIFKQGFSKKFY